MQTPGGRSLSNSCRRDSAVMVLPEGISAGATSRRSACAVATDHVKTTASARQRRASGCGRKRTRERRTSADGPPQVSLAGAGWWWQSRTVVPNAALTDAVVAPVAAPKSIAILPLANLSDDKDTGFFADGVHEDFLTNFALVPELRVVSRTSVMQYRATTKTMKQIGEELGVAYVLVGSLRHAAGKIRVTGELIDTRTDEHVRAKSFDRDLTDIFALLTELSSEIARALSAVISPQTQKFLARRPTETPAAYDAFPRARNLRNNPNTGSRPALRETEVLSKSAVQLDPAFAAAWGELAVVHAPDAFWAIDGSAGRLAQAAAAIARAVRLAPEEPEVIRLLVIYA